MEYKLRRAADKARHPMANLGLNYSDWVKQNPDLVSAATARVSPPGPPPAPVEQPPPAPAETSAPVTQELPKFEPVTAPTGAPKENLDAVRSDMVSSQNDVAESFLREAQNGEDANNAEAKIHINAASAARRYARAAEENHDENNLKQTKYKQWIDEDLQKLREPPVEPPAWKKALGIIGGIVGATAQGWLGAPGAGIAYGMDALNAHMNKSVRDQLSAKDQAGNTLKHTQDALDTLGDDSENESEVATKLVAHHWFATSRELDKIAASAKSPAAKEAATRLALGAQDKARGILAEGYREQIAEARALAAARAKGAGKGPDWSKFRPEQLEAWAASGKLDYSGLAFLEARRKEGLQNSKTEAEIEKLSREEVAKPARDASAMDIPGYVRTKEIAPAVVTDANKKVGGAASMNAGLDKLKEIYARNQGKPFNATDQALADTIIDQYADQASQLAGGGQAGEAAKQAARAQIPNPTSWDSLPWRSDPVKVYDGLKVNNATMADTSLKALGYEKGGGSGDLPPDVQAKLSSLGIKKRVR